MTNRNEQALEWEEGYRAGINECLARLMLSSDTKRIWDQLKKLHEESTARTDDILNKMEAQNGAS